MRPLRTRVAIALISLAVIAFELALMRALSLRFWHHFAYMVISVALLGFGASGTALTLLRRRVQKDRAAWMAAAAMAFSLSVPLCLQAARRVRLDVQFLAWDLSELGGVLLLELILLVPFFFAAAVVGAALMDRPHRIGGHYAANLAGSGLGAILSVALMHVLTTPQLLAGVAVAGCAAAAILTPWRRRRLALPAALVVATVGLLLWRAPYRPRMSPYKMLPYCLAMPDARVIGRAEGPLGRIDVVVGPAIHHDPPLSLQYMEDVPAHALLIVDGDQTSAVYDCPTPDDWRFMDYTTGAVGYALDRPGSVCVIGAGGGADIGLAVYHRCDRIIALEMNGRVIAAMRGPLADRGGRVYAAPGVEVVQREARGFFAAARERFDLVQLPAIDAFGASGAGLYATQEAYLYTVESMLAMLDRLSDAGCLCITRWSRMPPREGLRIFDTAAQALRRRGREPARHLAMIRGPATVTVLACRRPLDAKDADRIRQFCRERSFDLCHLPGMAEAEANRFQKLDRPYYFEAADALLGPQRKQYLSAYLFDVAATTDDKPYFFHFLRWRTLRVLQEQLGRRSRAFWEMGFIMLLAALVQAVVLAAGLILLPLLPRSRPVRSARGKALTLAYFLLLGAAFMLLEMGFLQKLILYLSHPIYSAAVAIAAFLLFAGLGSRVSGSWPGSGRRVIAAAAAAIVCIAVGYVLGLDAWLALTQGRPLWLRLGIAAATIAPLAFAMGHMFPLGLRAVASGASPLVGWAWAVNGFASVAATVAAPLLAMRIGFSLLTVVAIGCYFVAGMLGLRLVR
jgi:hypothetical protein